MLDSYAIKVIKTPLNNAAALLQKSSVTPNQLTLSGFLIGLTVVPLLAMQLYIAALFVILINRIVDGLDGALARRIGVTDYGGYLDIVCDFIFYSAVVVGFALAQPETNALAASVLIWSFMGTGSSFLAFAILAAKKDIKSVRYPHKSLYYLGGLTEGLETIAFFVLCCLFPDKFPVFAWVFSAMCAFTTLTRILSAHSTFKE
ncbi:CDP-alcohol phosphatidyltransferase family protein [Aliagarivorans marinus]|uniref:CDP-alcohol phosphatidyltransferase family protein n=1 Tax=Aliagarivorans marinus TaxID=561965 RepID=UPI0004224406|nr:CDP-alcohol phosphatidyltransferase family protein [Aliagarivorans marinus]